MPPHYIEGGLGRYQCEESLPMPRIDESRPFIPVRIAVMTVSDSRTPADDRSGNALVQMLSDAGHILAGRAIIPDDQLLITAVPASPAAT